jgi:prepilin-type N-terminal cleavage/methylation domain-containing protein
MNSRPTGDRRGFSLIEMMVVISAGAVLLGLCVVLIHTLLRLDRTSRARMSEGLAVGGLARDFRDDVRAARSARLLSDSARAGRLELFLPDGRTVSYRTRDGELVRLETLDGEPDRIERYHVSARPELKPLGNRTLVGLSLGPRDLRIEAVLGLDRRFDRTPELPGDPFARESDR